MVMAMNEYKSGEWNAICATCGLKFKSSKLRKRWDGFWVCKDDWNVRHPLDFIKSPPPEKPIPWSQPEPTDVFLTTKRYPNDGEGGY